MLNNPPDEGNLVAQQTDDRSPALKPALESMTLLVAAAPPVLGAGGAAWAGPGEDHAVRNESAADATVLGSDGDSDTRPSPVEGVESPIHALALSAMGMPLIDNTIYTTMARVLGGKPEPLDALPVPKRNIFSLAVRLNKRELLGAVGMEDLLAQDKEEKANDKKRPSADTQKTGHRLRELDPVLRIGVRRDGGHRFAAHYTGLQGQRNPVPGGISRYVFNYPIHNGVFTWQGSIGDQFAARTRMGITERLGRDPYAIWDLAVARSRGRARRRES